MNKRAIDKRARLPSYRLECRLKSGIANCIRRGTKKSRTYEIIGCNLEELFCHLEQNFKEGMTRNNYGQDGWVLDHIRPRNSFTDLEDDSQLKACWNWRNLQPLWWKDNRYKSDDYTPLDELAWVERMLALGYEGELFLKYEEGNSY